MKIEIKEFFSSLDKRVVEFIMFMAFVLFGVMIKIIREKKKPTFKTVLAEIAMSFFVSGIVYAVLVQFFEFNNFFVFTACSYAGSISSKFLNNLEKLFESLIKAIPEKFKSWGNTSTNNEENDQQAL